MTEAMKAGDVLLVPWEEVRTATKEQETVPMEVVQIWRDTVDLRFTDGVLEGGIVVLTKKRLEGCQVRLKSPEGDARKVKV